MLHHVTMKSIAPSEPREITERENGIYINRVAIVRKGVVHLVTAIVIVSSNGTKEISSTASVRQNSQHCSLDWAGNNHRFRSKENNTYDTEQWWVKGGRQHSGCIMKRVGHTTGGISEVIEIKTRITPCRTGITFGKEECHRDGAGEARRLHITVSTGESE
jgi:hypothetical protein